jgi:hypothetical protein
MPVIREAEIEAMTYDERQRRRPEIAAAVAAKTIIPKRYGSRENDRGWSLAALEAEEFGPPPDPKPIHYEGDLARLAHAERVAVYQRAERGEAEIVPSVDGRRTFLERLAAVKAEHEKAAAEWSRLTSQERPGPARKPRGVEALSTSELIALLDK